MKCVVLELVPVWNKINLRNAHQTSTHVIFIWKSPSPRGFSAEACTHLPVVAD